MVSVVPGLGLDPLGQVVPHLNGEVLAVQGLHLVQRLTLQLLGLDPHRHAAAGGAGGRGGGGTDARTGAGLSCDGDMEHLTHSMRNLKRMSSEKMDQSRPAPPERAVGWENCPGLHSTSRRTRVSLFHIYLQS